MFGQIIFLIMQIKTFIDCLRSDTRRRILQLLSEKDMTTSQLYDELGTSAPKYRQSVNKAIELLREGGLVTKYYNTEEKGICYHLKKRKYILKIDKMEIE